MPKEERVRETMDSFSYILLQGLHYPTSNGETLDAVFADLLSGIDLSIAAARQDDSRRLLQISRQEAEEAYKRYAAGDLHGGGDLIQRAEEHFKNGVSGRKIRPTFLAGSGGVERTKS